MMPIISNYQLIVQYSGEQIMKTPQSALRFAQLSQVHPEVKLLFINSGVVIKTKQGRKLEPT